jgi:type IV pilus assembly protein PilM
MSRVPAFLASTPPTVGVEIAADRVTAVSLTGHGGRAAIGAHATERLPAGAVTPFLNATNINDRAVVAAAVRAVFDRLGGRPRRVALVIPDTAAKVSLLRFEKVPAAADLEQLIRWQVRKAAPFKPEESQLSWVPGVALDGGGREFIVTLARRDIVESYERVCEDAGAQAGVVDLATFNLINAALAGAGAAGAAGDWLLVHVAMDYATLAIVRGGDLIFIRTRAFEAEGDLADVVHQTAMYHEDRLGGQRFARVVLCGGGLGSASAAHVRQTLEERLGARLDPLDFRGAVEVRDRISAAPDLLDTLAPAVGVVLRERVA